MPLADGFFFVIPHQYPHEPSFALCPQLITHHTLSIPHLIRYFQQLRYQRHWCEILGNQNNLVTTICRIIYIKIYNFHSCTLQFISNTTRNSDAFHMFVLNYWSSLQPSKVWNSPPKHTLWRTQRTEHIRSATYVCPTRKRFQHKIMVITEYKLWEWTVRGFEDVEKNVEE